MLALAGMALAQSLGKIPTRASIRRSTNTTIGGYRFWGNGVDLYGHKLTWVRTTDSH